MRRRFRLSLILAVIGLPVSGFFIAGSVWPTELAARASVPQSSHNGDPLSADELARLAPGDFILRRGNSLVSRLIVYSLGEPTGYSHCGILWPDPASGTWQVIHSVSEALSGTDGLRREPLADFWRKSLPDSTTVVRYRADQATVAAMLETANRLLAAPPAFDNGFQLGGDSLYCSELLWLVRHPFRILPGSGLVRNYPRSPDGGRQTGRALSHDPADTTIQGALSPWKSAAPSCAGLRYIRPDLARLLRDRLPKNRPVHLGRCR